MDRSSVTSSGVLAVERPQPSPRSEQVDTVGRRLGSCLRAVFDGLLPVHGSVRALAEHLRVDANVCQRARAAALSSDDGRAMSGAEVLRKSPGVEGLRAFVLAVSKRGGDKVAVQALGAAIEQFASLIAEYGSHVRLRAALNGHMSGGGGQAAASSQPGVESDQDKPARRRLFESAAAMLGLEREVSFLITAARPLPTAPGDLVEGASITGMLGQRFAPGSMPLEVTFSDSGAPAGSGPTEYTALRGVGGAAHGTAVAGGGPGTWASTGGTLLAEFSSHPLPTAVLHGRGSTPAVVIDAAKVGPGGAVDVVIGMYRGVVAHPTAAGGAGGGVFNIRHRVKHPTRRLITDTYVHVALAQRSLPFCGAYLGQQSELPENPSHAWYARLPGSPLLRVLGRGIERSDAAGLHRHAEMTRTLFERMGWNPEQFVGYRLETDYPVWGASYITSFDFAPAEE